MCKADRQQTISRSILCLLKSDISTCNCVHGIFLWKLFCLKCVNIVGFGNVLASNVDTRDFCINDCKTVDVIVLFVCSEMLYKVIKSADA